eukprot:CAMPEP_0177630582 /NCGR_PEP_ID=MMETSP0447-20121125/1286_1 /TAXON_ID=0 /ORGANISM="Stygamoeba regulata, Strain BSH-02190019" /LENGTH=115 /DNA_ID=CAMNT_0019131995 /DNA_START=345 /DNA_END=692 /DNA_ORIENTATION=-
MSGIAIGLNKGHAIQKRTLAPRPSNRKGASSKRGTFVKDVVREVSGYAPYEKRIIELMRNQLDKRALRFAKKRVGSHQRAKRKREELANVARLLAKKNAEAPKAAAAAAAAAAKK